MGGGAGALKLRLLAGGGWSLDPHPELPTGGVEGDWSLG